MPIDDLLPIISKAKLRERSIRYHRVIQDLNIIKIYSPQEVQQIHEERAASVTVFREERETAYYSERKDYCR